MLKEITGWKLFSTYQSIRSIKKQLILPPVGSRATRKHFIIKTAIFFSSKNQDDYRNKTKRQPSMNAFWTQNQQKI
jgi:hypothetical protein